MKHKIQIVLLLVTVILTGCDTSSSLTSSEQSSEHLSSTSEIVSESSETETTSAIQSSVSSEPDAIDDPDVPQLTRSESWPKEALDNYLTYGENVEIPSFESETSFHHGIYYNYLELDFYRVLTRVRTNDEFLAYKTAFLNYGFSAELEKDEKGRNSYRVESMYDEVCLFLQAIYTNNVYEVTFDFYDGAGDCYDGLKAVDNVAYFDFTTEIAVASKSNDRVKWEVRPASFIVQKGSAGYPVGNANNANIKNPLVIYAGNIVTFRVAAPYYITNIYILAASGYLDRFLDQGNFNKAVTTDKFGVDQVNLTFSNEVSELIYTRQNVTGVGQTRIRELKITFALRQV